MRTRSTIAAALAAAIVLAFVGPVASADEPPSYGPFEETSKNGRFVARVEKAKGEEVGWTLTVYEKPKEGVGERRALWSCGFVYSGYPGAMVSDDGKCVATLEVWYDDDGHVIHIYREGKRSQVRGKDVPFDRSKLRKTVSHELWLHQQGVGSGFDEDGYLVVRTIDGKDHRFDTRTGKLVADDGDDD